MGKIVTPGGGGGADTSIVTASAGDILLNKVIVDKDGNPLTGTMSNNGAVAPSALGAGGSYTIPEGYHNGGGIVNVKSLAELTADGDATAAQILSGKKAYVDGSLLTGTMAIQSAISFSAAAQSTSVIRISWKNPSKGPWTGVKIRMSTSGSPGVSGGTLKYTGTGRSTTPGGTSYVDITGLNVGTTYYFTCYSYVTGLGDSTTGYNVSAKTKGLLLYDNGNNIAGVVGFCNNYEDDIVYGSSYIQLPSDYGTGVKIPDTTYDLSKYTKLCITLMYNNQSGKYVYFDLSGVSNEWISPYPAIQVSTKVTYTLDITGDSDTKKIKLYIYAIDGSTSGGVTNKTKIRLYKLWLE